MLQLHSAWSCVVLLAAGVAVEAASSCPSGAAASLASVLAGYAPAQSYCSSNYPLPAVTSTSIAPAITQTTTVATTTITRTASTSTVSIIASAIKSTMTATPTTTTLTVATSTATVTTTQTSTSTSPPVVETWPAPGKHKRDLRIRATTTTTSTASPSSSSCSQIAALGSTKVDTNGISYTISCSSDFTGQDIATTAAASFSSCFAICDRTTGCVAFSFTGGSGAGTCYLKNGVTGRHTSSGVDTGALTTALAADAVKSALSSLIQQATALPAVVGSVCACLETPKAASAVSVITPVITSRVTATSTVGIVQTVSSVTTPTSITTVTPLVTTSITATTTTTTTTTSVIVTPYPTAATCADMMGSYTASDGKVFDLTCSAENYEDGSAGVISFTVGTDFGSCMNSCSTTTSCIGVTFFEQAPASTVGPGTWYCILESINDGPPIHTSSRYNAARLRTT